MKLGTPIAKGARAEYRAVKRSIAVAIDAAAGLGIAASARARPSARLVLLWGVRCTARPAQGWQLARRG